MSVNRLFETIYYLIEHKQTTAKELAEHFEVSTRTIYRDLDRLIVAGFPIYANQGAKGGIYIDSEFVLDKMTFSDDEQNQILMALQCIERLQDRDEAGLIDKMAALFNKNKLDWIEVDFTTWHHNNSQNEKFETIKKAIFEQKEIKFKYINSYGEKSQRCVFPNKLFFKANTWYLQGYCYKRNGFRLFRLSRMSNLQMQEEIFAPREYQKPQLDFDDIWETMQTRIKIRIHKSVMDRVLDFCTYEDFSSDGDEHYIVNFPFVENEYHYDILLSFGNKCECLEPLHIRAEIKRRIHDIAAIYRS